MWLPHDGVEIDDIDDVTILENVTRLTTLDVYPTAEGTAGALHMHLQRGRTSHENHDGDFGYDVVSQSPYTMEIRVVNVLDYETTPWYSLRLSVSVSCKKIKRCKKLKPSLK